MRTDKELLTTDNVRGNLTIEESDRKYFLLQEMTRKSREYNNRPLAIIEVLEIAFLWSKQLLVGNCIYFFNKIRYGFNYFECADSFSGNTNSDDCCDKECHFCKSSSNTQRGLKFYYKKRSKFYHFKLPKIAND